MVNMLLGNNGLTQIAPQAVAHKKVARFTNLWNRTFQFLQIKCLVKLRKFPFLKKQQYHYKIKIIIYSVHRGLAYK